MELSGNDTMNKQLIDYVHTLFDISLNENGRIISSNYGKNNALIDFLLIINKILDKYVMEENIPNGFIYSGHINEETGMSPSHDNSMACCKQ